MSQNCETLLNSGQVSLCLGPHFHFPGTRTLDSRDGCTHRRVRRECTVSHERAKQSPRTPPWIEGGTTIKTRALIEARPTIPHPALTMGRIAHIIMSCSFQIVAVGSVTPCIVAATIALPRHLSEQVIVCLRSQWQTNYRLSWYCQARTSQGEWQSPAKSICKAIPILHVTLSCCRLTKRGSRWIQSESSHGTPLGYASMEQGSKMRPFRVRRNSARRTRLTFLFQTRRCFSLRFPLIAHSLSVRALNIGALPLVLRRPPGDDNGCR